jgi:iron complex outermembrane receptor protein
MKRKRSTNSLCFIVCLLIFTTPVFAQTYTISGTVLDEKGLPVSFATVILEGTQLGANSDDDGAYSLIGVAPGTYTLKASYVGYLDTRQQVTVATSDVKMNLSMKPTFQSLNEVVVVGYQTQKRSSITGACFKCEQ